MLRYVALQWNPKRQEQCDYADALSTRMSARTWERVLDRSGLRVFTTNASPSLRELTSLSGQNGVILGSIFKQSALVPRTLDGSASLEIVATKGRTLVESYWGTYIAFIYDAPNDAQWVLRSPMCHLPCYSSITNGVTVYFSLAEDCVDLALARFTINWDFVAAQTVFHTMFTHATGINEVSAVLPGECIEFKGGFAKRHVYWNPCTVAASEPLEEPDSAMAQLRQTAIDCVDAWKGLHPRILHRLSGGLDSSIVLACMKRGSKAATIKCLNFFDNVGASDERRFARLVADHLGYELVEQEVNRHVDLRQLLRSARTASPADLSLHIAHNGYEARIAATHGASAISSAVFGDAIFLRSPAMPAAAGHLRQHGPTPRFLRLAYQVALLDGVSLWKVLGNAFRDAYLRRFDANWLPYRDSKLSMNDRVVSAETIEMVLGDTRFSNQWFRAAKQIPVGKRWQIFFLPVDDFYYDPILLDAYPHRIDATMSQPLVDLCLRIPAAVLLHNGWSRGLARAAFRLDLPTEITQRTSKGNPSRWVSEVAHRNRNFARELLLDGELSRRGILDRARLEEALSESMTRDTHDPAFFLSHLSTETWLQRWKATEIRAAA